MTKKRIAIYSFLIILATGVFYFRPYFENLYLLSKSKIENLELNPLSSMRGAASKDISAPPPLKSEKDSKNSFLTQRGVIDLTNKERLKDGKKELKETKQLNAAALKKAQDILDKQYFEHISPDGKGPDYFVSSSGYEYITIGENLALGNFTDDQDLVTAWMNSPGHRENILRSQFQEIGVAVVKGVYEGEKTWVAVQEFGTPESICPIADEGLKNKISSNTEKIDNLSEELKRKKEAVKEASPRDSSYDQLIENYNSLVNEYNSLVSKTKSLIEEYNSQVNRYNSCIKDY